MAMESIQSLLKALEVKLDRQVNALKTTQQHIAAVQEVLAAEKISSGSKVSPGTLNIK